MLGADCIRERILRSIYTPYQQQQVCFVYAYKASSSQLMVFKRLRALSESMKREKEFLYSKCLGFTTTRSMRSRGFWMMFACRSNQMFVGDVKLEERESIKRLSCSSRTHWIYVPLISTSNAWSWNSSADDLIKKATCILVWQSTQIKSSSICFFLIVGSQRSVNWALSWPRKWISRWLLKKITVNQDRISHN